MPPESAEFVSEHIKQFPHMLHFASMCSGSGMDHEVALSVLRFLKAKGIKTKFDCVFQCEKDPEKRRWLKAHFNDGDDPCLYTDVRHIVGRECTGGDCESHKKPCHVPSADVLFAGTSCKDFSRFNHSRSAQDRMNLLTNYLQGKVPTAQKSSSIETFIAAYRHIQVHTPAAVFLENSDGILDCDKANVASVRSNVDVVLQFLADLGYEAQSFIVSCDDFGCPQKRKRFWVLAILPDAPFWEGNLDFDKVFDRMQNRLREMKTKAPKYRDCLLRCEHSYVQHQLENRIKRKQNRKEPENAMKWPKAHQDYCSANSMRWPPEEFPSFSSSKWAPTLTDRERGVARMLQRKHGEYTAVDVSQEMGFCRVLTEDQHALPTILPGTELFVHLPAQKKGKKEPSEGQEGQKKGKKEPSEAPLSRLITGLELLRIQGFPVGPSDDCLKGDSAFTDDKLGHAVNKQVDAMHIVQASH